MTSTTKKTPSSQAEAEIVIFTDGACSGNPGPGGWGVVLKHPATKRIKTLSGGDPNTTNNRMELTAAIEALQAVDASRRRRIHLVSDSEYVIRGLREWIVGWIASDWRRGKGKGGGPLKNVDLWKQLYELTLRHDLSYEHVAAHSGHPENEECDRLAAAEIKLIRERQKLEREP